MAEKSFQSTLMSCRFTRSSYSKLFHGLPNSFSFSRDGKQLIFLSSGSLYSRQLEPCIMGTDREVAPSVGDGGWKKLCASGLSRELSRSEQLLRERMRATGNGITSYNYIHENDSIVVHGSHCVAVDWQSEKCLVEFPGLVGSIDHKVCPSCPTLLGCIYEGDVWVLDAKSGKKHQLTVTADDRTKTKVIAGQPSFIVQEEFDRYTGYWWQPQTKDKDVYRILFEEVNEKDVGIVHTFNPSSQGIEKYCYPKAGQKNASSSLKLLEFSFSENGELCLSTKALPWSLSELFPQCSEYIVRVGWMEDGKHVWVQLLDRPQKLLKVVVIAIESFVSDRDKAPFPYVLWEEHTEVWINVTDVFKFLPASVCDTSLQFLWCSESSGYMHLYLITARPPKESFSQVLKAECSVQQLTTGDWVVFGSNVWVDLQHHIVFFEANVTSPLEKHLYGVSLNNTSIPCENPIQLTMPGYYHSLTVDIENHCFVTQYSNECTSPSVAVYSITFEPLSSVFLQTIWTGPAPPADYIPPSRFQVESETGEVLHGEVYTPAMMQSGEKFATILYVYGGPHIQLVTRAFNKHLPRIKQWTHNGFVVVILDNRGSANRGLKFESYIKNYMGNVELKDQIAGLHKAITTFNFIDDSRIAITGWSYGGYLSLLGIAMYPQVFKVAISGAPVTDWLWYDTGYTERYLGVPPNDVKSYQLSSVLDVCDKFPNEPNRLLIVHGMNDENVLFTHTSLLCDKLVEFAKPYQLQLYTGERHGLRSPTSAIHCDATMLTFLYNNL